MDRSLKRNALGLTTSCWEAGLKPAQIDAYTAARELRRRNRFGCDFVGAGGGVLIDVLDDLIAHSGFPELQEMVGNSGDGLVAWVAREEGGDLIRHLDHAIGRHNSCVVSRRDAAYSCCQVESRSTGRTSTAVTLYSGQLVAQSDNSVVTTLAPVSG